MAALGWVAAFAVALTLLIVVSKSPDEKAQGKLLGGVDIIYYSIECGRSHKEPAVTWITDTDQLNRIYEGIRKNILGAEPRSLPSVDFDKEGVLLIEMGQRPTTGYQLITEKDPVWVINGIVDVKTSWIEPATGSIQAQVITSPCVLIKFPSGDYARIRVLDQNNQLRVETLIRK